MRIASQGLSWNNTSNMLPLIASPELFSCKCLHEICDKGPHVAYPEVPLSLVSDMEMADVEKVCFKSLLECVCVAHFFTSNARKLATQTTKASITWRYSSFSLMKWDKKWPLCKLVGKLFFWIVLYGKSVCVILFLQTRNKISHTHKNECNLKVLLFQVD